MTPDLSFLDNSDLAHPFRHVAAYGHGTRLTDETDEVVKTPARKFGPDR